ncbi:hypothetical protein HPB49_014007 [Dermacentor silvarum]|uniref:Uncharacterized protein n=1 Tax=Dermacentor silvarum TaxID=543639 RepID=A0ACB8D5Y7_DERSI|nr:hypothetical protein HPB49_014007 [Dermacentor silvarum]
MSIEVVVEGEIISPEDFKADAGWMESHRQRRAKILEDLNVEARKDNKNRNQDAEQREATRGRPRHRKQPQAPRLPELPKDDIKIILQPKEGLNVSKTSHVSLRDSILNAAGIHVNDAIIDTLRTNFKNIIMISTPDMARARRYNGIKAIVIQEKRYEIMAYATSPEDTAKGVIHNIPEAESEEDITKSLVNIRNPTILQARRMGKTTSVVLVFKDEEVRTSSITGAHVVLQPVTEGSPILARESRSMRLSLLVELGQPASECCIPALTLPPPLESRLGFPELQEMEIHRVRRAVLWEGASRGADVALELVGPSSYV